MIYVKLIFLLTVVFNTFTIIKAAAGSTCTTKTDCGAGFSCVMLFNGISFTNVCLKSCSSNADCNGGTCDPNPAADPTDTTDKMCSTALNPTTPVCSSGLNTDCTGTQNTCSPYDLTCQLAKANEACTSTANCINGLSCQSGKCQIITTTTTTTTKPPTTVSGTCVDLVTGGSNDCASMVSYCKNSLYLSLMKEKCPKTCGYCTTNGSGPTTAKPSCVDLTNSNGVSDCPKNFNLCTNTIYRDLMKTQCPKTCGYC